MRLLDLVGQVLELEIVGYQFPDEHASEAVRERAAASGIGAKVVHDPKYDDNWLIVRGHIEIPRGTDFRDPSLLTWEAEELCGWLRAASKGQTCGPISFLEPNLSFKLAEPMPEGDAVRIMASFALEARPPWVSLDDFEATVEFQFRLADVSRAAEELTLNLDQYPERGS